SGEEKEKKKKKKGISAVLSPQDTVERLLRLHFRDDRTRVNGDALRLTAELLKVFVRGERGAWCVRPAAGARYRLEGPRPAPRSLRCRSPAAGRSSGGAACPLPDGLQGAGAPRPLPPPGPPPPQQLCPYGCTAEAAARAARQAQAEDVENVNIEHVEKVLPQLVRNWSPNALQQGRDVD
uniref:Centromere protein X n=1 Tax=Anas zonorhyncha TaxID=75864 RepID=A0A8B9VFI2_9AVES